jgi:hypothetical protein
MKIVGLIPMSAKPYHIGHDALIRIASAECDTVFVFVSIANRENIDGKVMHSIWLEQIAQTLPSNVQVSYEGNPIRNVYKHIENVADDTKYVIYSDTNDANKNFPISSLQKYAKDLFEKGLVTTRGIDRSQTIDISGTQMRGYITIGDKLSFLLHIPKGIDGEVMYKKLTEKRINEDYGGYGGDYAGLGLDTAMGGMSPFGAHFASGNQLYNAFVKPFVDVVQTAAGKTKEITRSSLTLLATVFESVKTTLVPALKANYEKIFEQEKKDLEKIRSEYQSVYNSTWEAFADPDVMIPAFMMRPDLFVTAKFIRESPKVAKNLLNILTGGKIERLFKPKEKEKRKYTTKLDKFANWLQQDSRGSNNDPWGAEPGMSFEGLVREDKETKQKKEELLKQKLLKLVHNKDVIELIRQNPEVERMMNDSKEIVGNTLNTIIRQAEVLAHAHSLKEIETKLDIKIPELAKLNKIPQDKRQEAEKQLLDSVRSGMIEVYVTQLQSYINHATKLGISEEHPFIKAYKNAITKIKSL